MTFHVIRKMIENSLEKILILFLSTISRFETQSIASIKGEDMDSIIDGFHTTKVEKPKENFENFKIRSNNRFSLFIF